MDITELWEKALARTDIIRSRISLLETFSSTRVPYILLSESSINKGDTVVRKGEVLVEKPSLILPPHTARFEGFEFDQPEFLQDDMMQFLMVRGINLPSMKYNNTTNSLDIFEGELNKAIDHYLQQLQSQENVNTGLLAGPEDVWQFSTLIFTCSQIARNADTDIRRLMDKHQRGK